MKHLIKLPRRPGAPIFGIENLLALLEPHAAAQIRATWDATEPAMRAQLDKLIELAYAQGLQDGATIIQKKIAETWQQADMVFNIK